jgi:hypothetical protein
MAGHEELKELLGAYALDAVTREERRTLESHLRGCDDCRTEVLEHLEVAAGLGAHAATPPPPDLWDRITHGLDDMPTSSLGEPLALPRLSLFDAGPTVPDPGVSDPAEPGPGPSGPGPSTPPLFSSNPSPTGRRGRGRAGRRTTARSRVGLVVAAAAAVVVMVLGVGLVGVTLRQPGSSSVEAAAEAALADPANHRIVLASPTGDARAVAVISPTGEGFMVPDTMAPLPEDRTYQLWEIGTAGAVSLGVLGNEPGATAFHVDGAVPTLAVTNEVAGGVPAPRSAPVLTGMA